MTDIPQSDPNRDMAEYLRGRTDGQEAAEQTMGWRPIETAPEDERIIIFVPQNWVDTAFWVFNEDIEERDWYWSGAQPLNSKHVPTHWMPLPELPK